MYLSVQSVYLDTRVMSYNPQLRVNPYPVLTMTAHYRVYARSYRLLSSLRSLSATGYFEIGMHTLVS